jgi:hypothetical protein
MELDFELISFCAIGQFLPPRAAKVGLETKITGFVYSFCSPIQSGTQISKLVWKYHCSRPGTFCGGYEADRTYV